MNRITLVTIIAILFAAGSANAQDPHHDHPVTVTPAAPQQVFCFVGVSDLVTTGDAGGLFGMSDICAEQFGAAKVCTMEEAHATIAPPNFVGNAWVSDSTSTDHCGQIATPWTESRDAFKGRSITPGGSGTSVRCDVSQPVACCGWAPID